MPVLKLPNPASLPKDALVLDLGDLQRQGEMILSQARDRAAQVLAQAKAERERLISTAAAEGRAAGHTEGLAAGRAEGFEAGRAEALAAQRELLAQLAGAWTEALERFLSVRERLIAEGRREVVRVASAIASRVVKRTVDLHPEVVVDQLGAVLALVTRRSRLRVRINPDDRGLLERAIPAMTRAATGAEHVELVDDPTLARGSCVAVVEDAAGVGGAGVGGEVDASIPTQLDRIVSALLPGEGGAAGGAGPAGASAASGPAPPAADGPSEDGGERSGRGGGV